MIIIWVQRCLAANLFLFTHALSDPTYAKDVPNLDGGEGHSEHILFGTDVDLSKATEQPATDEQLSTDEEQPATEAVNEQQEQPGAEKSNL